MTWTEFLELWDNVIAAEGHLIARDPNVIFVDDLKDEIFAECDELIKHCKRHYMKSSDKYIDRHKIAAAVMISLLKYTPIKIVGKIYYDTQSKKPAFNEHLAITTGLSILRAFIEADLEEHCQDDEKYQDYINKIKDGIILPVAKHGDYRNNWANELYYTRKDGNYNLLALAHELYFLERNTIIY